MPVQSQAVKQWLWATMSLVPNVGVLEKAPLDTDKMPQALRAGEPRWYLRITDLTYGEGVMGSGIEERTGARLYGLRAEGWLSFGRQEEQTTLWEETVEQIHERLLMELPGLQTAGISIIDVRDVRAQLETVQVSRDGATGFRAHHAVIECRAMVWQTWRKLGA